MTFPNTLLNKLSIKFWGKFKFYLHSILLYLKYPPPKKGLLMISIFFRNVFNDTVVFESDPGRILSPTIRISFLPTRYSHIKVNGNYIS
jgi:hypothetical protein